MGRVDAQPSRLATELDIDLDTDPGAVEDATRLTNSVPGDTELLARDPGGRTEYGLLVAPRVSDDIERIERIDRELDRTRDVTDGEFAGQHLPGAVLTRTGTLERQRVRTLDEMSNTQVPVLARSSVMRDPDLRRSGRKQGRSWAGDHAPGADDCALNYLTDGPLEPLSCAHGRSSAQEQPSENVTAPATEALT